MTGTITRSSIRATIRATLVVRSIRIMSLSWSPVTESNRRPSPYHGDALPTELTGPIFTCPTWGFAISTASRGRAQRWPHLSAFPHRRRRAYRTPAVVAHTSGGLQPVAPDIRAHTDDGALLTAVGRAPESWPSAGPRPAGEDAPRPPTHLTMHRRTGIPSLAGRVSCFNRRPRRGCPRASCVASAGSHRQPGGQGVLGGVDVPVVPGAAGGARPSRCAPRLRVASRYGTQSGSSSSLLGATITAWVHS